MLEIAIDACVFVHLLNIKEKNPDGHIDSLLNYLLKEGYMLLVDSTGKVAKDYQSQVIPMIKGGYEEGNQRIILTGWMRQERRKKVDLDPTDPLMTAIKRVILEVDEHADRAFVYVACKNDADLITNDEEHIWNRRTEIMKKTKRFRGKNTEIVTSREAYERIA